MISINTKLSTITAAIATIAIIATLGIIGTVGQQQQMASAIPDIPLLDEEQLRADLEELEDGVIEREICPDQIVRIPGDGYVCIPKFDLLPE
jgi:hypothetical protein